MTILTGGNSCLPLILRTGVYPTMALLFSYGILAFFSPDPVYLRSHSNVMALMWLVVSIVEFFAYGIYAWAFGYASERMVRRVRRSCFQSILRQNAAFFDRDVHSTGTDRKNTRLN